MYLFKVIIYFFPDTYMIKTYLINCDDQKCLEL